MYKRAAQNRGRTGPQYGTTAWISQHRDVRLSRPPAAERGMTQRLDAEARAAEEAEIATWLHDHGATKLRKRPANAPPIAKIREALRKAGELTVSRAGGRKIKFRAQPLNDAANLAGGSQPHKPASVTRRNRRAANKLSARS